MQKRVPSWLQNGLLSWGADPKVFTCCACACFCILVTFPPLNDKNVTRKYCKYPIVILSCHQTLKRLTPCFLLACEPRCYVATLFVSAGIDKGIVYKNGKLCQGIQTLGTGSQPELVFDSHPESKACALCYTGWTCILATAICDFRESGQITVTELVTMSTQPSNQTTFHT